MATPESKVKAKVVVALKALGVYYFFPVASPMYGTRGVPDIVACVNGRFVAIECKAGKNTVTELQQRNLDSIKACQGVALVCTNENVGEVVAQIRALKLHGGMP